MLDFTVAVALDNYGLDDDTPMYILPPLQRLIIINAYIMGFGQCYAIVAHCFFMSTNFAPGLAMGLTPLLVCVWTGLQNALANKGEGDHNFRSTSTSPGILEDVACHVSHVHRRFRVRLISLPPPPPPPIPFSRFTCLFRCSSWQEGMSVTVCVYGLSLGSSLTVSTPHLLPPSLRRLFSR